MDKDVKRGILANLIGVLVLFGVAKATNLLLCALIALAINWFVFLVHALPHNSEKFFDGTGSLTYLALVGTAVFSARTHGVRQIVNPLMVCVWCIRLGSYLLARIMRDGKDSRFDDLKVSAVRFLGIWTIQANWCLLVSSPALVVAASETCTSTSLGMLDFVGWASWVLGFIFEVVADRQKDAFRTDSANKGKFITTGLWAYSRHPNYFGEIAMWVGLCLTGSSCFQGSEWLAWLSPVTTWLLLMKVSGVPMLEAKGQKTWGSDPEYLWYMEKTPCVFPAIRCPPRYESGAYVVLGQ